MGNPTLPGMSSPTSATLESGFSTWALPTREHRGGCPLHCSPPSSCWKRIPLGCRWRAGRRGPKRQSTAGWIPHLYTPCESAGSPVFSAVHANSRARKSLTIALAAAAAVPAPGRLEETPGHGTGTPPARVSEERVLSTADTAQETLMFNRRRGGPVVPSASAGCSERGCVDQSVERGHERLPLPSWEGLCFQCSVHFCFNPHNSEHL